jgi:hypothetical protein
MLFMMRLGWLVLALLSGCASTSQLPPVAKGEFVSINVVPDYGSDGSIYFKNDAIGGDVGKSSGEGALLLGLSGLSCGPLVLLCVPAGAAVGALIGAAAGVAESGQARLSWKQADQLRDRFFRLNETRNQLAALEEDIRDRAADYLTLDSEHPAHLVTVRVSDLVVGTNDHDQVRIIVRVVASIRKAGEEDSLSQSLSRKYEFVGPYCNLQDWLNQDSGSLEMNLDSARQNIASRLVSDLAGLRGETLPGISPAEPLSQFPDQQVP